jgi:hypothetical protein
MHATRLSLLFAAVAAACTSSSPESAGPAQPPELVISASCSRREDTVMVAFAIGNRGRGPAAPAATRVEFNDDPGSAVVRRTHFIAARAVDTFEVELPAVCSKIACRWTITVDAAQPVRETGHC